MQAVMLAAGMGKRIGKTLVEKAIEASLEAGIKKFIIVTGYMGRGLQEYFLQIANLYKKDYVSSCNRINEEREQFSKELSKIKGVKVYPSEANYILCKLEEKDSTLVAANLLEKNIFIKDLKTKDAFKDMNYIRLAVRTREENKYLVEMLKEELDK